MQTGLRAAASHLANGLRRMGTAAASESQEAIWAKFYPKYTPTAETTAKNLKKEMIGFMILGPIGAGFMVYDFVIGLEEEHHVVIPPYPWMRIRRSPGMPWGEDSLFEKHPRVAKVWPPEEGDEPAHH